MKKPTYAVLGALFIVVATITQRIDGGGLDLALLIALGLVLLVASADQPRRGARAHE